MIPVVIPLAVVVVGRVPTCAATAASVVVTVTAVNVPDNPLAASVAIVPIYPSASVYKALPISDCARAALTVKSADPDVLVKSPKLALNDAAEVFVTPVTPVIAALAGATEVKPPNARAATATADTFFNEIVFTIFLSFSQIKDDLLPGW
jgi:hypothetical protein